MCEKKMFYQINEHFTTFRKQNSEMKKINCMGVV